MSKALSAAFRTLLLLLIVGCGRSELAALPAGSARLGSRTTGAGTVREVVFNGGCIGRTEVTCGAFESFLNSVPSGFPETHPQFRREGSRWKAIRPRSPVASVTRDEAEAYCAWRSKQSGRTVRLPTEDEWEYAARGGARGAPYPWGWDRPQGRATWRSQQADPVASHAANGFGLFDMAGNLAEWCRAESANDDRAAVRGGNWTDRSPDRLRVFSRVELPANYRDRDVGFRVFVEPPCR